MKIKQHHLYLLAIVIIVIITNCKKDEINKIAGTYTGELLIFSPPRVSAYTTLTKKNENFYSLSCTFSSNTITLDSISVRSSGSGVYTLTYSGLKLGDNGIFSGKVDGNHLTWTLWLVGTPWDFSGYQ